MSCRPSPPSHLDDDDARARRNPRGRGYLYQPPPPHCRSRTSTVAPRPSSSRPISFTVVHLKSLLCIRPSGALTCHGGEDRRVTTFLIFGTQIPLLRSTSSCVNRGRMPPGTTDVVFRVAPEFLAGSLRGESRPQAPTGGTGDQGQRKPQGRSSIRRRKGPALSAGRGFSSPFPPGSPWFLPLGNLPTRTSGCCNLTVLLALSRTRAAISLHGSAIPSLLQIYPLQGQGMTSQRSPSHFSFPKPAVCPPTGSTALARMGRVVQVALFTAGPHPKKTPWSRPTGGRRSRDSSSRTHAHTKSTALGQELPPLVLFFSLFSDLSSPLLSECTSPQ